MRAINFFNAFSLERYVLFWVSTLKKGMKDRYSNVSKVLLTLFRDADLCILKYSESESEDKYMSDCEYKC